MRCQSPPLEETQGILVMQSSTATLLILLRPPKVGYLLFAKARKSPLQNKIRASFPREKNKKE
jgi:hypothetical protein